MHKTSARALFIGVVLLLGAIPARANPNPSVLITELNAQGVGGSVILQITSSIAQALSDHGGHSVLTMADIKDLLTLEESKQLLTCQSESCLTDIQKLKDVDLLLSGTVGKVGSKLTVSLSLIDVKQGTSRNRVSTVIESMPALPKMMAGLTAELFEWKQANQTRFHLPEDSRKSFAVLDLDPSGVAKEVAVNLTQVLSAEFKKIEGAKVISRDDIKTMLTLEADKQLLGCADDMSCMAEIGSALGVEYIVAGHVGKLSETFIVSLRLIDPANFEVKNRVTESYVGVEDQLVGAVRHTGRKLLGVAVNDQGALSLSTNEGEGSIFLDGRELKSAGEPIGKLATGRHSLRIIKEDFLEWQSDIYVHPGGVTSLSVELQERPDEWYESWLFWTAVAGLAVVGAGVGVGLALSDEGGGGTNPENTFTFGLEIGMPGSLPGK